MSADSALRANVRLLGDLLGRVLVEQEGEGLLDDEERIRALARDARASGSRAALGDAVAALGLERQAAVQRSFALFFQLANIAEQHHRIRRRREYEAEGRVQRESLADAFAQLERSGVDDGRARRRRAAGCASSSCSRRIRPRRHAAPSSRRIAASRRSWPGSTTTGCRHPSGVASKRASPRRSRCSGRPTRCAPSALGSSTRSGRGSGSSSRASGTPFPTSSAPSPTGSREPRRGAPVRQLDRRRPRRQSERRARDDRGCARACAPARP